MLSRRAFVVSLLAPTVVKAASDGPVVRLVFPFPAGGGADGLLRAIALRLKERTSRRFVVENVTGAGGRIGVRAVKDAPADGRTLLFTSGAQMVLQPHVFRDVGYSPFEDFVPLASAARFDQALAVRSESGLATLGALTQSLRANPGSGTYASPGLGTLGHFAGVEYARLAGLELTHVPYRGTPAALVDLLAGRLSFVIASLGELTQHHRAGTLKILALASGRRSSLIDDIPTFEDAGVGVRAAGYFAFYARRETPPDIVSPLQQAILATVGEPDIQARMRSLALEPPVEQDLVAFERQESERWREIVRRSGFRPEE
jgi:tripartite-type tricarboxylate transporter receptor subunit TctC